MFDFMKKLILFVFMLTASYASAQQYYQPLLTGAEVVEYLLSHEQLNKNEVKPVLLKFDYLKNIWHVELVPANDSCLDCYPSYYIENEKKPKITKLLHG